MSLPARLLHVVDDLVPADVFLPDDAAPFGDDDLDVALSYVGSHDGAPGDLLALEPDEVEQGEHLTEDAAATATSIARVAGYRIRNSDHAEWAAAKYARAARDLADAKARHEARVARLEAAFAAETRRAVDTMAFFDGALSAYALARRSEDPKRNKTTTTSSVRISTRTVNAGGAVKAVDEEAVIAWARAADVAGDVVVEKPKVIAAGLRSVARIVLAIGGGEDLVLVDRSSGESVRFDLGGPEAEAFQAHLGAAFPASDECPDVEVVVGPDWLPVAGVRIEPEDVAASIKVI